MLIKWFKHRWFKKPTVIESAPIIISDDVWIRSKQLSDEIYTLLLEPLSVEHFDISVNVRTDNIYELLSWVELSIRCIEFEENVPEEWKLDQRMREPIPLPDYYYHDKTGYWEPQAVWIQLLEKIRIIHHLIEVKAIDRQHNYHFYMRAQFTRVISDVLEVMETSLKLSNKS